MTVGLDRCVKHSFLSGEAVGEVRMKVKITLTPAQRLRATILYFLEQAASAMPGGVMHLASTLLLDATR